MKYIIFDLDDTILNGKSQITKYTSKILTKAKSLGYIIVINTARSLLNTQELFEIIKPDYAIYGGGSIIVDKNNNPIYLDVISKDTTNSILKILLKEDIAEKITIETVDNLYSSDLEYVKLNPNRTYFDFNNEFPYLPIKILTWSNNQDRLRELAKENNLNYINYRHGPWGRFSSSSKYLGNKKLFELLNDNNPLDYVFGDDIGDLEMIQKAYEGVLLKNANKSLHSQVKNITKKTNKHNGVAKYVNKVLKKDAN